MQLSIRCHCGRRLRIHRGGGPSHQRNDQAVSGDLEVECILPIQVHAGQLRCGSLVNSRQGCLDGGITLDNLTGPCPAPNYTHQLSRSPAQPLATSNSSPPPRMTLLPPMGGCSPSGASGGSAARTWKRSSSCGRPSSRRASTTPAATRDRDPSRPTWECYSCLPGGAECPAINTRPRRSHGREAPRLLRLLRLPR